MIISDAHEALFGCKHLGCITMMPVASCIPFPFFTSCDDMLTMLICATRWLSMHFYTLAYMFMHESCLLVCRPCFNNEVMDIQSKPTFVPREHHLLFAFLLVCLFACLFAFLFLFLPLLICWFLVFAFACTHMERGSMELGHDLPGASKKAEDASIRI